IGVLMWQISSGRRPYYDDIEDNIRKEEIIPGTPFEYSSLYAKCMEYEPCERPNMLEIVISLDQLTSDQLQSSEINIEIGNLPNDNASKWIENALNNEKVRLIPFNELQNPKPLDAGNFGCVMKATWIKTNTFVACKKLTNIASIKGSKLDAFIHELQIYLQLDCSDRIVRCLGISQEPNSKDYLLIMQYANGGDLQNYLEKNFENLTWYDKKKLAIQIAEGLNYLHNEKILHRDLHSKNIVIHDDKAKITDFGISKNMNKNTQNSSIHIGHRENAVKETPKLYEELYKKCWDSTPEKRPSIRNVLKELDEMIIEEKMSNTIEVVLENSEKKDFEIVNSNPEGTEIDANNISTEKYGYYGKEIKEIFEEADKEIPNISISRKTNPDAIYTSRAFTFKN
ncbi:5370_t:CDS:2, partial [Funneliformis mosseae]